MEWNQNYAYPTPLVLVLTGFAALLIVVGLAGFAAWVRDESRGRDEWTTSDLGER